MLVICKLVTENWISTVSSPQRHQVSSQLLFQIFFFSTSSAKSFIQIRWQGSPLLDWCCITELEAWKGIPGGKKERNRHALYMPVSREQSSHSLGLDIALSVLPKSSQAALPTWFGFLWMREHWWRRMWCLLGSPMHRQANAFSNLQIPRELH